MRRVVVCAVIMVNVYVVRVSKLGGAVSIVRHPGEAAAQIKFWISKLVLQY